MSPRLLALLFLLPACAPAASPEIAPPLAASPAPVLVPAASGPVASASASAPAPLAACLPPAAAEAELFSSRLDGDRLTVCTRSGEDGKAELPCIGLDLSSRQLFPVPALQEEPPYTEAPHKAGPWTLETTSREVKVCAAGGACRTLKVAGGRPVKAGHGDTDSDALIAALSPDGARVAVLVPERKKDRLQVRVEVLDAEKGRRLQQIAVPAGSDDRPGLLQDASDNWAVSWMGMEHLYISAHRCCGPAGAVALLDLKKKSFEPLGDPSLRVEVKPGVWLLGRGDAHGFRGDEANRAIELTVLHLASGKRTTVALPARPNKEPEGHELDAHRWKGPLWALVHSSPPGVTWFDVEQEKIVHNVDFPPCR